MGGASINPENAFLQNQSREARDGLEHALGTLPRNVRYAVSPRAWTARYPWAGVSAVLLATVGGVVVVDRMLARREHPPPVLEPAPPGRPKRRSRSGFAKLLRWPLRQFVIKPMRAAVIGQLSGFWP